MILSGPDGAGFFSEVDMKVVLFNGSPHEKGCTNRALEEMVSVFDKLGVESEIFHCSFDRDDIAKAVALAEEADGIVLSSPVYYASATGLASCFFDELFSKASVRMKVGAAVTSCRRGGASATFDQLNKYFTISEMITVGSDYWNQVHGNTPEEVAKDEEGLQTMRILARNMVYVIASIKKAGLPLPETEKRIKTNFIR